MPIGRPLPGYDAYILDESLKPVSDGETGHLFIGGPAVARGYLDRPDLTEKAFLQVELPVLRRHSESIAQATWPAGFHRVISSSPVESIIR